MHRPPPTVDLGGVISSGYSRQAARSLRSSRPESWWSLPYKSPELYAACLHGAICFGGRIRGRITPDLHEHGQLLIAQDHFLVPDSYHVRDNSRTLPSDLLGPLDTSSGHESFRLLADVREVRRHEGVFYFAGAAFGHFGHFLLEGLSRWWFLDRLPPALRNEIRFVVYDQNELHDWQLDLLAMLGVSGDRLVYLSEPARFERLIVPARAYNLHQAAAQVQGDVYNRIGAQSQPGEGHARVYISRSKHQKNRALIGEHDVEQLFETKGFQVIHPQELAIADQIAACRSADLIAGSAGSGMYLAAFGPSEGKTLIISPHNFTFRDDQLLSELRGRRLCYFLCPQGEPSGSARDQDYTVQLDVLESAIDEWIAA